MSEYQVVLGVPAARSLALVMRKAMGVVALVGLLAGCATAYQPMGFTGGYTDTQVAAAVFQVRFEGNGYSSDGRVQDLALLRSAALTLQRGYKYFKPYAESGGDPVAGVVFAGNTAVAVRRPTATLTIQCFSEKPPTGTFYYDAALICKSLGKKYGVTCGG